MLLRRMVARAPVRTGLMVRAQRRPVCRPVASSFSSCASSFSSGEQKETLHAQRGAVSDMTEAEFHARADRVLERLEDGLVVLEEEEPEDVAPEDEVEVSNSMGVLTLALGERRGTWVINKQTPNRQIWWSSPLSGPRRYEYRPQSHLWVCTRDDGELFSLLTEEMKQVMHVELTFDNDDDDDVYN